MTDLMELAAKCRNPIVRNALLAAACARDAAESGLVIATKQKRCAMRTWTDAIDHQREETWGVFKTGRGNDPKSIAGLKRLDARTVEAQNAYMAAERAVNALRAIRMTGTGKDTTGGAERL